MKYFVLFMCVTPFAAIPYGLANAVQTYPNASAIFFGFVAFAVAGFAVWQAVYKWQRGHHLLDLAVDNSWPHWGLLCNEPWEREWRAAKVLVGFSVVLISGGTFLVYSGWQQWL